MTRDALEGHFVPGREGPVFVLRRGPARAPACVVIVPPFAEEMNKSRRMLTLVSSRLAGQGIATVLPDFYGTGDSGGDFADGSIELWRDDLARVMNWCSDEVGPVRAMLAVRLGCALACDGSILNVMPHLQRSVLWQPAFDGSRFTAQFLRLRVAAAMANGVTETVADLRREASQTGETEVAGYRLSAKLLTELEQLRVPDCLPAQLGAVEWCEIVRDVQAGLPLPSQKLIGATQSGGGAVQVRAFTGEPFWSSTEIVTHDAIVDASVSALVQTCAAEGMAS